MRIELRLDKSLVGTSRNDWGKWDIWIMGTRNPINFFGTPPVVWKAFLRLVDGEDALHVYNTFKP